MVAQLDPDYKGTICYNCEGCCSYNCPSPLNREENGSISGESSGSTTEKGGHICTGGGDCPIPHTITTRAVNKEQPTCGKLEISF